MFKKFNDTSLVVLDDFLNKDIINDLEIEIKKYEPFKFNGINNIFLGTNEIKLSNSFNLQKIHTKKTISYDKINDNSPLKILYKSDLLINFISSIVGKNIYRSADEIGAITCHIHDESDEQDWHFDVSEYTIVLHILKPKKSRCSRICTQLTR